MRVYADIEHKLQGLRVHRRNAPSTVRVWARLRPSTDVDACFSRLRGNIIRTAPCWVVWPNVHSQQHTYMSSSYRSSRLGLSHWDPYAMRRGGCLELYYCNMVEWSWWDSSLIWRPTGFLQCFDTVGLVIWRLKIVPEMTYNVSSGTLSLYTTPYRRPSTREITRVDGRRRARCEWAFNGT